MRENSSVARCDLGRFILFVIFLAIASLTRAENEKVQMYTDADAKNVIREFGGRSEIVTAGSLEDLAGLNRIQLKPESLPPSLEGALKSFGFNKKMEPKLFDRARWDEVVFGGDSKGN